MSDDAIMLNGDCLELLKTLPDDSVDSLVTDPPAGISFMGKSWDEDKGGRKQWIAWMSEVMVECLRVLKPGAHGLVWAIPRTSHWTATALEDAGFEIRDVVTHIFGSGFPKSHDISKAFDKTEKNERPIVGYRDATKSVHGTGIPDKTGSHKYTGELRSNEPVGSNAHKWQGFGTALKPASEHWILVRKPLSEDTIAANVLKHGVGGLNIDASRIEGAPRTTHADGNIRTKSGNPNNGENPMPLGPYAAATGRFPANLVLSHNPDCEDSCTDACAVAALDAQPHEYGMKLYSAGNKNPTKIGKGKNVAFSGEIENVDASRFQLGGDPQSVSRFFYCAKASKKDKGAGNVHPTVKSSSLMSYLIKLITPPKGIVLDPFAGSGSTGVSAVKEGFAFIGIEKELEYYEIAVKRIS